MFVSLLCQGHKCKSQSKCSLFSFVCEDNCLHLFTLKAIKLLKVFLVIGIVLIYIVFPSPPPNPQNWIIKQYKNMFPRNQQILFIFRSVGIAVISKQFWCLEFFFKNFNFNDIDQSVNVSFPFFCSCVPNQANILSSVRIIFLQL